MACERLGGERLGRKLLARARHVERREIRPAERAGGRLAHGQRDEPVEPPVGRKAREHIELYATSGLPQGVVPPEEATRSVLDLARNGRPDDEFVALRREVQTRRRGGPGGPLDRPPLQPAPDPPPDR